MESLLVFVVTLAVAAASGSYDAGLRVTYGIGSNIDVDYFFDVPRTQSDARAAGWKRSTRPKGGYLPDLVMLCPSDKMLCVMYDDTEYVAGVQLAIPKLQFSNAIFDWEKRGFTSWYTAVGEVCKKFWTIQQYFVTEEFLQISKEEREASRNSSVLLQAGGVWVTGVDNEIVKISTEEADIRDQGVFLEQACFVGMGLHYYYNMTTSMECTDDQIYPWFALVTEEKLVGTGFLTVGNLELEDGTKNRYESPSLAMAKAIGPWSPQCLYDLIEDPGITTMHVFYIDQPWTITC